MMTLTEDLRDAFREKAQASYIVIIEERDGPLYVNTSTHLCGGRLHNELTTSEEEFNLAGKALSVGLSTAAVAHAMRSVEASLHAICKYLVISFPGGIDLQDWANLTDKIESEISKIEKQPRSQHKAESLKRLAELMLPADAFRLAWRNHVAHAREKYEAEEARQILRHVADYLKRLSDAL
jgi:hypothetical protein